MPTDANNQTKDLGNQLNSLVISARNALFNQSELAQLTYTAFGIATRSVDDDPQEHIDITFPIGMSPSNTPLTHTNRYTKQQLLERYRFLGINLLAVNAIFHLVTAVEAMLNDVVRAVIRKHPKKLSGNREVSLRVVLAADTIEAIHDQVIDRLLNELSYKSPTEYTKSFKDLVGIDLFECTSYHKYVELKATRDVYMHNRGYANQTYARKAELNARAEPGNYLPVDVNYFLASYEQCLKLTEWLEERLHEIWHSSDLEARKNRDGEESASPSLPPTDATSEKLRAMAARLAKPSTEDGSGT